MKPQRPKNSDTNDNAQKKKENKIDLTSSPKAWWDDTRAIPSSTGAHLRSYQRTAVIELLKFMRG